MIKDWRRQEAAPGSASCGALVVDVEPVDLARDRRLCHESTSG
jgi:hypothetical protein